MRTSRRREGPRSTSPPRPSQSARGRWSRPDTAVCDDCLREPERPSDAGTGTRSSRAPTADRASPSPRISPYDRPATTMAAFTMCERCVGEYADRPDRRHHAQPIACHDCGPTLRVTDAAGAEIASGTEPSPRAVAALRTGRVAIKGVGGYHLACDAASQEAVAVLRARKQRPDQLFAVMAADLATAARIVEPRRRHRGPVVAGATDRAAAPASRGAGRW